MRRTTVDLANKEYDRVCKLSETFDTLHGDILRRAIKRGLSVLEAEAEEVEEAESETGDDDDTDPAADDGNGEDE